MGAIVLSDIVPLEIRGTYQSVNNLCYGTGSMLGAAMGGMMADVMGWRWEFGIQVPVGIFCMVLAVFTIPSMEELGQKKLSESMRRKSFDYAGSILLVRPPPHPLQDPLPLFNILNGAYCRLPQQP